MCVRVCVRVHVCVHAHTCMFLHISFVCVLWLQFSMLVPISQWWQATHQFSVPHFQPSNDLRLAASFHHQRRELCTRTDSVSEELGVMLRNHTSRAIVKENALCMYVRMYVHTVHDTENLTFSEEFRGCSARNDVEFLHGCRGTSVRAPRIFRAGGRRSSAQTGTNLPCGFGLKMAETRRRTSCATTLKNRETCRKDRSKYHYRTRTR